MRDGTRGDRHERGVRVLQGLREGIAGKALRALRRTWRSRPRAVDPSFILIGNGQAVEGRECGRRGRLLQPPASVRRLRPKRARGRRHRPEAWPAPCRQTPVPGCRRSRWRECSRETRYASSSSLTRVWSVEGLFDRVEILSDHVDPLLHRLPPSLHLAVSSHDLAILGTPVGDALPEDVQHANARRRVVLDLGLEALCEIPARREEVLPFRVRE